MKKIVFAISYIGVFMLGILFTSIFLNHDKTADLTKLVIPTEQEVKEDGYPTNAEGITYGPTFGHTEEPDLVLVGGKNENTAVNGYAYQEDLQGPLPMPTTDNPEVLAVYNNMKPYKIPIYLQDGKTVVGEFIIG